MSEPKELLEMQLTSPRRYRFKGENGASEEYVRVTELFECCQSLISFCFWEENPDKPAISSPVDLLDRFASIAQEHNNGNFPGFACGMEVLLSLNSAGKLEVEDRYDEAATSFIVAPEEVFVLAPFGADVLRAVRVGYDRIIVLVSKGMENGMLLAYNDTTHNCKPLKDIPA